MAILSIALAVTIPLYMTILSASERIRDSAAADIAVATKLNEISAGICDPFGREYIGETPGMVTEWTVSQNNLSIDSSEGSRRDAEVVVTVTKEPDHRPILSVSRRVTDGWL